MALFNNFCVLLTFAMSFTMLVNTSLSGEISQPSQSPSSDFNYAPRPLSAYENYINNCISKMKENCANQFINSLFESNQTISNDCCLNLVKDVGKSCLVDTIRYLTSVPMFQKNKMLMLSIANNGTKNIWHDCNLVHSYSTMPIFS